jgi:hypothetical protein
VAGSEWVLEDFEKDMATRIDATITQQRNSQIEKISLQAVKFAKSDLVPDISGILRVADDDMWAQMGAAHAKSLSQIANNATVLTSGELPPDCCPALPVSAASIPLRTSL